MPPRPAAVPREGQQASRQVGKGGDRAGGGGNVRPPAGSCVARDKGSDVTLYGATPEEDENIQLKDIPDGWYPIFLRIPDESEEELHEHWSADYEEMIQRLRHAVSKGQVLESMPYIHILPEATSDTVEVVMYKPGGKWIILAFQCMNLYLIGFYNASGGFRFNDDPSYRDWTALNFSSQYKDLKQYSNLQMPKVKVGITALRDTVDQLSDVTSKEDVDRQKNAGCLFSVVYMFSEAARFDNIVRFVVDSHVAKKFGGCLSHEQVVYFNSEQVVYFNSWATLSKCLIVADRRPGRIPSVNRDIGLIGLKNVNTKEPANTVEDMQLIMRVLLYKTYEEPLGVIAEN